MFLVYTKPWVPSSALPKINIVANTCNIQQEDHSSRSSLAKPWDLVWGRKGRKDLFSIQNLQRRFSCITLLIFFFNLKSKFWAASNVSFWDNEAHVAKWLTFKLHALKGKKFSYSKSSNVSSQYLLGPLYKWGTSWNVYWCLYRPLSGRMLLGSNRYIVSEHFYSA